MSFENAYKQFGIPKDKFWDQLGEALDYREQLNKRIDTVDTEVDRLDSEFKEHCIRQELIVERLTTSQEETSKSLELIRLEVSDMNNKLLDDKAVRNIYADLMKDYKLEVLEKENSQLIDLSKTPGDGVPAVKQYMPFYKRTAVVATAITTGVTTGVLIVLKFLGLLGKG